MRSFNEFLQEVSFDYVEHDFDWAINYADIFDIKNVIKVASNRYANQVAMQVLEDITIHVNETPGLSVSDFNKFVSEYKIPVE